MTGIIILAAGGSTRLGQAKQQLLYQGQTLLQRAIQTALASGTHPVIVVLGANAESIQPQIEQAQVHIAHNPDWAEGMSSSIKAGMMTLQKLAPTASSALFLLCDQPFIETALLHHMKEVRKKSGKGIVACSYQNTLGAPVLFDREFFPELEQLQGQEGAKKLLSVHADVVVAIPFERGAIDIDTPADYQTLIQS